MRQTAEERQQSTTDIVRMYGEGISIRNIATGLGRSYGYVHRILTEAQVTIRPRGGNKKAPAVSE